MTVNVLCHIDRLPDYGTSEAFFSLNLTVALDAKPGSLDATLVSPWKWKVSTIDVYFEKAKKLISLTKTPVARLGDPVNAAGEFAKKLDGIRDGFAAKDLELFVWKPAAEDLTRDASQVRWSDYLIHASTFPAALTQEGGITMMFKVTIPADADRIIVAPRIDFGAGVREPKTSTNDDLKAATELKYIDMGGSKDPAAPPFFYAWMYEGTSPDVIAYQRECRLDQLTVSDQFFDVTSGWIKGVTDTQSEDWALVLEARASAAFDLSQRMIEALVTSNTVIDGTNRQPVIDAVTAAFHDIAGTGSRHAAGPKIVHELARHVLRDLDEPHPEPLLKLLQQYDHALTAIGWKKLLREVTDTRLFKEDGTDVPDDVANDQVLAELQRMHGLLSDEGILRRLLLQQWTAAVQADVDLKDLLSRSNERLQTTLLPNHNLRKAFLFEALQEVWSDVSALGNAKTRAEQIAELKKSLLLGLGTYFTNRYKTTIAGDPYFDFNPTAAALPAALLTIVTDHLKDYVENTFAPLLITEKVGDEHDALVIQLADVRKAKSETVSEEDQNESSRRMSGYGVLLRRTSASSTSAWSCLNLANVVDGSDTGIMMAADPQPVPVRLGFRHGVRQTFIAYENVPLVAESPLLQPLQDANKLGDKFGDDTTPLFRFRNPYGATGDMPKLVPLAYGDLYEAAPFAIGNAGALPAGFAKTTTDGGGAVTDAEPWKPSADPQPPNDAVRKLQFRRRTPIGVPRVRSMQNQVDRAFEQLALPPIPRSVLPIARSIASTSGATNETPARSSRPLLLLRPKDTALRSFEFKFLPPSIDIHTWDRWKAGDTGTRDQRITVWETYHELADTIGTVMNPATRGDLTLDDPAVNGWSVQLTRVFPTTTTTTLGPKTAKLVDHGGSGLDVARHKPLHVVIQTNTNISVPAFTLTDAECNIALPPGEVWKVEIAPTVDQAIFQKKFITGMAKPESLILDAETVPTQIPFKKEELLDALVVSHEMKDGRDDLKIEFDGSKVPISGPFMHRVEAVLQQWRWSGRPIYRPSQGSGDVVLDDGFVDARVPDENDDAILFADRSPLDAMVVPNLVDLVAEPGKKYLLHRRDLRGTKGALYFRVALRCFSRYEGIEDAEEDSRNAKAPESWMRILIPCRWKVAVPKPVIKLVLPLTRPIDSTTPPLLVVLDEPWGDTGGLAEKLTVDIIDVTRGDDDTTLQEIGPDPILTVTRNLKPFPKITPIGPIGYTFDTDTDAPLFVKSSFIVPPPDAADDLSWYFVKLQFRRTLTGKLMNPPLTDDVQSEPTQPVWCQFLPPSTRFASDKGVVDVADLTLTLKGTSASFVSKKLGAVTLKPAPKEGLSRSLFECYVILTRPIVDASGRPDQEMFATFKPLGNTGTFDTGSAGPFRSRIIEVQRRLDKPSDTPSPITELWKELFEDDPTKDVTARIVRMSPPIEQV